jgi:ATP-dependent DNA helicase RecG
VEQLSLFDQPIGSYSRVEMSLLTPSDIYAVADETLLSTLKEDRRIERKRATIHGGELGEYFSMWANTPGDGGLIVLGQENGGLFSGCSNLSQEKLNDLEKAGHFHCPNASYESKRIPVTLPDGTPDFVVLVRVYYNSRSVIRDVRGKAYGRVADSKEQLTDEQIKELQHAKGEIDLEQEPVNLVYPDDFDSALIRQYVDGVIREKDLTKPHSDVDILAHGRLGKLSQGVFTPNVACALLFAKDPLTLFPGCKVRFLRFDGEVELTGKAYNSIKGAFIEGPIPLVIEEAARQLKSQLREFSSLADDNRFYSVTEYPEEAWYEALVNACVHRSYTLKNMVTFVKMFDDRLVIESPGGFPPNVTPETIYTTHSPRNPHLMQALYFMSFVKCHNEGAKRMRDAMDANNLPKPEFAQKQVEPGFNSVRVTLRNNIKLRNQWIDLAATRVLHSKAYKDLDPIDLRILNYVAEHGKINVSQCQKLLGASGMRWQRVKKILTSMVVRGLLAHHHHPTIERDSHASYQLPDTKQSESELSTEDSDDTKA